MRRQNAVFRSLTRHSPEYPFRGGLVISELLLLLRGEYSGKRTPKRTAAYGASLAAGSFEARAVKLGIIGYGHIGTQLGILAESLGCIFL